MGCFEPLAVEVTYALELIGGSTADRYSRDIIATASRSRST